MVIIRIVFPDGLSSKGAEVPYIEFYFQSLMRYVGGGQLDLLCW